MTNVKDVGVVGSVPSAAATCFFDLIPELLTSMSRHPTLGVLAIAAFAALCAALSASPASAQSKPCDCHGLSGGPSRGQIDESRTSNRLIGPGLTCIPITSQDRDLSGAAGPFHNTPGDRRSRLILGVGLQHAGGPAILRPGEVERYRDSDAVDGPEHGNALGAVFPLGRLSFSANPLFGFNPSTVRPVSKAGLDTPDYNQKLALHRTGADKAYLASHTGLSASKISAAGKAETPPMTEFEDCKGYRAALVSISCLQAHRRVDVEVTGTC